MGCGLGCAALVAVQFVVLWTVLQLALGARGPRAVEGAVKAIRPPVAGRPFQLEVTLRNEGEKPVEIREVTYRSDPSLKLSNPEPAPAKAGKLFEADSWTYNRTLQPGEKWTLRFRAVAPKPGKVDTELEVFAPGPRRIPVRLDVAPAKGAGS